MIVRSMIKVAAATALYGLLHSALASQQAKQKAAEIFGDRQRNGWYRVFYIGQSVVTFAALAAYIRKQPSRELYHIEGLPAGFMHAGQVGSAVMATLAAHQVGIPRILGWKSLSAWFQEGAVPPEPEAQGPALDEEGASRPAGPFALIRHPLNFAPIPIFWLWPRMTTNLLAFNMTATVYLILGSVHEEWRLRQAYGEQYRDYQESSVPFFLPKAAQDPRQPLGEVLPPSTRALSATRSRLE